MRGPLVFLLSLVGVTVLGIAVLGPVRAERDRRAVEILERASGLPHDREPQAPPCVAAFAAATGLTRGPDDPQSVVRRIALDFTAMDRIAIRGRHMEFPIDWADVPRLLARLAAERGLVFEEFRARPDATPDRCRITLEFAAPATGLGVR